LVSKIGILGSFEKKEYIMKKCIKVQFSTKNPQDFLKQVVPVAIKNFRVEGFVQVLDMGIVQIFMCASQEELDNFLDLIYENIDRYSLENIEVEPFLKDRDFRGVFRVVE